MPLYEYRCPTCNKAFTAFKKLVDYQQPQPCSCGVIAEKVISKPMVAVDFPAYQSPATGKWIEGRKAHVEDLKRSGCRLLEPGERADAAKRVVEQEKTFDSFVDNSVDKVFAELKG